MQVCNPAIGDVKSWCRTIGRRRLHQGDSSNKRVKRDDTLIFCLTRSRQILIEVAWDFDSSKERNRNQYSSMVSNEETPQQRRHFRWFRMAFCLWSLKEGSSAFAFPLLRSRSWEQTLQHAFENFSAGCWNVNDDFVITLDPSGWLLGCQIWKSWEKAYL
jgi:hypothetical protein